jgi:thiol:disulfide interchange protein DsbG
MRFFVLYLAILVAISSFSAYAQEGAVPPLPAPLKTMVEEGAQIRYLGNDLGLDGWVTIKNAQEQYFYVTPDQQGLVMGVLFNSKGDTVTLRQINQLRKAEGPAIDKLAGLPDAAPPPSREEASKPEIAAPKDMPKEPSEPSKSEKFYTEVEKANWIALGQKNAPALYTFIDPECPHCHDMITDVRKSGYLEKGLLQLRLIPVGLMSENSLVEASFLLAAPNAQELLYKHLGWR